MNRLPSQALWVVACIACVRSVLATSATPDELNESATWAAARFQGIARRQSAAPALVLVANHDQVEKNGRQGKPLRLADREFHRGLYVHAPSQIIVRLPGPGDRFTAVVGIDSNENTRGGRGSVEATVRTGGVESFRSGVLREGMGGIEVAVNLNGAAEFVLQAEATPDGIACDQLDWAEAKVRLQDGSELWLADLALRDERPQRLFAADLPFSFVYDGKALADDPNRWQRTNRSRVLDSQRTEHTVTLTDPATHLEVRCAAVEYSQFPTVEWTLYFRNTGTTDTPILENVQALDVQLDRGDLPEFLLHHAVGSPADGNDYAPRESLLPAGSTRRFGGAGGRPTSADWSYFNLEWPVGRGVIAVVGWPGQWAAEFVRDAGRGLRIRAGQELTRFRLLPGEEVRSPLIVLQFWQGDWIRAQNIWRRWMMAHSMPRLGGKLPPPQFVASSSRQYDEMIKANETNQILFINRYVEEGLRLDYWWMDAGWYEHHGKGWPQVGTWLVDSNRFPRGLRAVSDHARAMGMKTVVWFEPERVTEGTWLARHHPDWILGGAKGGLLNLGDEAARAWLIEHIDQTLREQGVGLYRQDFNMDPLNFWRKQDPPDRQGITEIKHVTGLLAFWDELRRRHPDLLIDACASGGRRNDLETMRRAVPLWRSDYAYEATGHQSMTYGLSLWLPYHGTGTVATRNASYYGSGATPVEAYAFWSNTSPSLGCGFDMREKLDYAALRRLVGQWRQIATSYYGDFYPLTPCSRDDTAWIGWQFDRPEAGEGMVQVFRRPNSFYETARLLLRGLKPDARYRVHALDSDRVTEVPGRELLGKGYPIAIPEKPGAAVAVYAEIR